MQLYGLENTKEFDLSFYALIAAGGTGTRVKGGHSVERGGHSVERTELPKQYLPLAGRPMLWHAVKAVCVPPIENVLVVLSPEDREFARHDWGAFGDRVEPLYCGGATRRDSVYNGMVAAMAAVEPDDWMLVHDAARPCLPAADLASLIRERARTASAASSRCRPRTR